MGVDPIVMGTHGKTGLKRLLMRSTMEKVIGLQAAPFWSQRQGNRTQAWI
jgi:hypothetical protein